MLCEKNIGVRILYFSSSTTQQKEGCIFICSFLYRLLKIDSEHLYLNVLRLQTIENQQ